MHFLVSSLIFLFFLNHAAAHECVHSKIPEQKGTNFLEKRICNRDLTSSQIEILFEGGRKISQRWSFDQNEKLVRYESFSIDGDLVLNTIYKPVENNRYIVESFFPEKEEKVEILIEAQFDPEFKTRELESTYFKNKIKTRKEEFTWISGRSFVKAIEKYDAQGELEERYDLRVRPSPKSTYLVDKFKVSDRSGKTIGFYDYRKKLKLSKSVQEKAFRKKPVVIIDSGFDWTHPLLKEKLAIAPGYKIFDNEKIIGWAFEPITSRNEGNPQEQIFYNLGQFPFVPFSHGTHVAGIAMQNIDEYGVIGFVGDYSNSDYLEKISAWISASRTMFVNMSFGFGNQKNPFAANPRSRNALAKLMEENNQTLFFVAAGNSAENLDDPDVDDVPSKSQIKNKIVVSALDTAEIDLSKIESYRLTHFSNYGKEDVSFAAPGDRVRSTNIGGLLINVSGTSMSSPYALNAALRVAEANKSLTIWQIKEILEGTVYIPKTHELPVKTKGILIKERAVLAAKLMKEGYSLKDSCKKSYDLMKIGAEQ